MSDLNVIAIVDTFDRELDTRMLAVEADGGDFQDYDNIIEPKAEVAAIRIAEALPEIQVAIDRSNDKLDAIVLALGGTVPEPIPGVIVDSKPLKAGYKKVEGTEKFTTPEGAISVAICVYQGKISADCGEGDLGVGSTPDWYSPTGLEPITFTGANTTTQYLVTWVGGKKSEVEVPPAPVALPEPALGLEVPVVVDPAAA